MENTIKKLLDYQRFEKNEKLQKLIRETERRYASELSDSELEGVSAAGIGQNVGGFVGKNIPDTVTGYHTDEAGGQNLHDDV